MTEQDIFDLFDNPAPNAVNTTVDVGMRLRAIARINQEIEDLKQMKKDYEAWFKSEQEKKEKQIDFFKSQLETYLTARGEKSVKTPAGRATLTTRSKVVWPSDDILISFSKENSVGIRTKEEPDKAALKAFIEDTGAIPPGYRVDENTSLTVAHFDVPEPELV